MTKEEINLLAEKILAGTASEEEIVLYNHVCRYVEFTGSGLTDISAAEKQQLEQDLKKAILRKTGEAKVYRMPWFKWVSVAAAFVLLAGAVYFFMQRKETGHTNFVQRNQQQRFKNEVLPGRQGAVLTLGNGQQIILDSAANGALASEGGARVIKKDGAISYDIHKRTTAVTYNTMTTPRGRQYQLTLSDGTAVWLNAGSSITYPAIFTGDERKVTITGEVYFEVTHNAQKPFKVSTPGGAEVQVLGTHFNINAYDDEEAVRTTLLQGSVKVVKRESSMVNGEWAILKPGEQAILTHDSRLTIADPDIDAVMAWKNGRFLFSGTGIESLMRQISRWYDVEVIYDHSVKDLFYAEIPRNTKLSDVLKALELTGKVHFVIDGKKIIVTP